MISSWYTYQARRMDVQMRCQDAQITIKEKMTTNNLWYCHPSSLVKYLPALREVKKCYDHALLVTGYDVLLSTLQGNLSFSTSSVSSFASTHAGPDYFSLLDLHLRHRTLSDSYLEPPSRALPHGQPHSLLSLLPSPL